jgi:hypothetical protein
VKVEMAKLLGRYLRQQGLYRKAKCCLSIYSAKAWGS